MHKFLKYWDNFIIISCYWSFAQSCLTLWDPMDCSMPGFPVLHHLPEFAPTHSILSMMPSNHLILCCLLLLLPSIFPASGSLPMSQHFTSGGQSVGVSASASVLPMNTQDLFPLRSNDMISLQSKGLSRVLSNTTIQSNNASVLSFLYNPSLTSIHDYWKEHSLG